jgi:hypothetical protein
MHVKQALRTRLSATVRQLLAFGVEIQRRVGRQES